MNGKVSCHRAHTCIIGNGTAGKKPLIAPEKGGCQGKLFFPWHLL